MVVGEGDAAGWWSLGEGLVDEFVNMGFLGFCVYI